MAWVCCAQYCLHSHQLQMMAFPMQGGLTSIPVVAANERLDNSTLYALLGTLYWDHTNNCYVQTPPDNVTSRQISDAFNAGQERGFRQSEELNAGSIERFQEQYHQMSSLIQTLQIKNHQLESQVADAKRETEDWKSKFARLQGRNRQLAQSSQQHQQTQELTNTLALLRAELENRVQKTNEELKKIPTLEREVLHLEGASRTLNGKNVGLQKQVDALQKQVQATKMKLTDVEKQRMDSSRTLSRCQEEWFRKNGALYQQINVLSEQKKLEIENIKVQLSVFMEHHQQKQADFRAKYNELKERMDGFLRKASKELKALNSQLAAKDEEMTIISLEVRAANARYIETNSKWVIAKDTLDGARKDNNELSAKLAKTKEELERQIALSLTFAKEAAQETAQVKQEKEQLARIVQELIGSADKTLQRHLAEATDMVAKQTRKIHDLKRQVQEKDKVLLGLKKELENIK